MSGTPFALKLYFRMTCAYGLGHAVPWAWSYKTNMYNTHGKRELLLVDKLGVIAVSTLVAPFNWPFLLREDLIRIECLMRGKPVGEYLGPNDD